MEQDLYVLNPTPPKPIKAVELSKKWGPIIPKYSRLITCSKLSNEIIDSIKDINCNKMRERTNIKRGKETATSNTTSLVNDADTVLVVETLNITAIDNYAEAVMSAHI